MLSQLGSRLKNVLGLRCACIILPCGLVGVLGSYINRIRIGYVLIWFFTCYTVNYYNHLTVFADAVGIWPADRIQYHANSLIVIQVSHTALQIAQNKKGSNTLALLEAEVARRKRMTPSKGTCGMAWHGKCNIRYYEAISERNNRRRTNICHC